MMLLFKDYITTKDAAGLANLKRQAINQAIWRGKLPAVKIGRDWHISRADFNEWLAAPKDKGGRPRKNVTSNT